MKVICIQDFVWKDSPKFGDIVHVLNTYPENHKGKDYYYHTLIEYGSNFGWRVENFAEISSNVDEMELLKERYGVEAENNFA